MKKVVLTALIRICYYKWLNSTKAAWRNGIASDYDKVGDQEIAGSTPAVVIFSVFNKKLLILAQFSDSPS